MHAPLVQCVGLMEALVAADPLLYVCMKAGAAVFYQ